MELYVKIPFISIFYIFFSFSNMIFIRCVDFTSISASNTRWWRHKL